MILSQNSFSKELFRFDFKSFFAMPGLETTEEGGSGLVLFQKSAFYAFPQPTISTLLLRIVLQCSPVSFKMQRLAVLCMV